MNEFLQLVVFFPEFTVVFDNHCVVFLHSSVRTGEVFFLFFRFVGFGHVLLPLFFLFLVGFDDGVFLVDFGSQNLELAVFFFDFFFTFGGLGLFTISG